MPHLTIEYSLNAIVDLSIDDICESLRQVMAKVEFFPLAGIRVRAFAVDVCSIADGDKKNQFVSMELRIGQGRNTEMKKAAGQMIFEEAQKLFADQLAKGYLALSLEIGEINAELSWKDNSIRGRLAEKA